MIQFIGIPEAQDAVKDRLTRLLVTRSIYFAAKETQVLVRNRVWGEGKLTNGGQITYQENYDLYAYQPPSPKKVTGKGKPYKLWKRPPPKDAKGNAAQIKGGYYASYLAYKQQQGRADTPFELTGRLRKAYLSDANLVEVSPEVTYIQLTGDNAGKYEGLTDKKGQFLELSKAEIEYYIERVKALTE
jgi:hypothetical protein